MRRPLWRGLLQLVMAALVMAAVRQELQKPPAQRTWHGSLWGWVPYDLRPPWVNTVARLRAAYWDPGNPRVFTGNPFGVGWALNLPALARWMSRSAMTLRRSLTA